MTAIPIPPDYGHGPFPDTPMGQPVMDDIRNFDVYDDHDDHSGSKKKGKKDKDDKDKDNTKPSRTVYECCIVERLKPRTGETLSWSRCGRRWMPQTQEELISLVKKHRRETRTTSASADFKRLGQEKQGIINRIIDEKKLHEKSKTAEWTLVDVQTVDRRVGWSSKETLRLQIVIKRTDKGSEKNGYAATNGTHSYSAEDVIDLSVPLEKKRDKSKDKDKDSKKNRGNIIDPLDDPRNRGFGLDDLPQEEHRQDHHHDNEQYYDHHEPDRPPPPAPVAPEWQHHQNPFTPQWHVDPQTHLAASARDFNNFHPAYPQHALPAAPIHYADPLDTREYIHPHGGARARTRSADRDRHRERSRSQGRRQSLARRPSRRRSRSRRRDQSVEDLRHKFDRMYPDDRDSNGSSYDERSMWSRSEHDRYSRSPDTSIYSDDYPRERNKPTYRRDGQPKYRYRSNRYQDVDVEPGYTHDRRHRDRRYEHRERRPPVQHALTYDDYPQGRGAEPRYLPAPPMQRRNTEVFGDKRNEYFDREWRQPMADLEREREADAFQAGIRHAARQQYYR